MTKPEIDWSVPFDIDLERLWLDIPRYLEFLDLAHEEDAFWKEYSAWKRLTDKREKLKTG